MWNNMIKIISLHFKDVSLGLRSVCIHIYNFSSLQTWSFFLFGWLLCLTPFQHQQQPQPLPQASPQLGGLYNEPGMQLRYSDLHSAPDNRQNVTNTKSAFEFVYWIIFTFFYCVVANTKILFCPRLLLTVDLFAGLIIGLITLNLLLNLQWKVSFPCDLGYWATSDTGPASVLISNNQRLLKCFVDFKMSEDCSGLFHDHIPVFIFF